MRSLKQALFDEYSGFADKRIKNLDIGSSFIIDDRTDGDIGADKNLLSYFCLMFANVESSKSISITLRGNVPMSPEVQEWVRKNKASLSSYRETTLSFKIAKGQQENLLHLASAIAAIVTPGRRYETPSYKYVCPRTASSLRRLSNVLNSVWSP